MTAKNLKNEASLQTCLIEKIRKLKSQSKNQYHCDRKHLKYYIAFGDTSSSANGINFDKTLLYRFLYQLPVRLLTQNDKI